MQYFQHVFVDWYTSFHLLLRTRWWERLGIFWFHEDDVNIRNAIRVGVRATSFPMHSFKMQAKLFQPVQTWVRMIGCCVKYEGRRNYEMVRHPRVLDQDIEKGQNILGGFSDSPYQEQINCHAWQLVWICICSQDHYHASKLRLLSRRVSCRRPYASTLVIYLVTPRHCTWKCT